MDIVTLAMAKAYTDEIAGGSGDGGVTIDLSDYGVNIFIMFAQDGGKEYMSDADSLWEKVLASQGPVTLHCEYGGMTVEDVCMGYMTGKRLSGYYTVCIDDFKGNREEFCEGLRLAGFFGRVSFA